MSNFHKQNRSGLIGERILAVMYGTILVCMAARGIAVQAEDLIIRGGPSIIDGQPSGASKYLGLREEAEEAYGVKSAAEFGGYVDNRGPGATGSVVGKLQLGVTPGPNVGVFGSAFTGPCLITQTDSVLGGFLQFCTDIGLGVRDSATLMRFSYSHISSAGMSKPNRGRDFVVGEMGLRF